jgi:CrcB protein
VRPAWLGVIVVGGAAGTSLRAALEGAFGAGPGEWPWVTFWINLGGAFMLGALLEGLAGSSLGRTWRRGLQLGLGTGLLGGFTTYSTFSLETVQLLDSGHWPIGLGYALAAVTGGVAAAAGGIAAVRRLGSLRAGGAR